MTAIKFPFNVKELFQKCSKADKFPRNDLEKQAILILILEDFKDKHIYTEEEVGKIIEKHFSDSTTLRRELINYGYMKRNPEKGTYWVVKRILTEDDIRNSTMLRQHARPYKVLSEDK